MLHFRFLEQQIYPRIVAALATTVVKAGGPAIGNERVTFKGGVPTRRTFCGGWVVLLSRIGTVQAEAKSNLSEIVHDQPLRWCAWTHRARPFVPSSRGLVRTVSHS